MKTHQGIGEYEVRLRSSSEQPHEIIFVEWNHFQHMSGTRRVYLMTMKRIT